MYSDAAIFSQSLELFYQGDYGHLFVTFQSDHTSSLRAWLKHVVLRYPLLVSSVGGHRRLTLTSQRDRRTGHGHWFVLRLILAKVHGRIQIALVTGM